MVRSAMVAAALAALFTLSQPAAPAWQPLFDGTSIEGWDHMGEGQFSFQDGLLKTEGGMGLLVYYKKPIGDAVLRVVYRTPERNDNAGVFIRIPELPTEPWMPVNRGFEVQIDESGDESHGTGTLYSLTKALARPGKAGDWNTLEITLDGKRTLVHLNGQKVTDYTDGQPVPPKRIWYEPERGPRPDAGYIGLQNHGEDDTVYFREVSVRPLR